MLVSAVARIETLRASCKRPWRGEPTRSGRRRDAVRAQIVRGRDRARKTWLPTTNSPLSFAMDRNGLRLDGVCPAPSRPAVWCRRTGAIGVERPACPVVALVRAMVPDPPSKPCNAADELARATSAAAGSRACRGGLRFFALGDRPARIRATLERSPEHRCRAATSGCGCLGHSEAVAQTAAPGPSLRSKTQPPVGAQSGDGFTRANPAQGRARQPIGSIHRR